LKNIFSMVVLTLLTFFVGQSTVLAAPAKVAVLPFKINAQEDLGFLRDGIQDMLGSRLSWDDKVVVIDKEAVNRAAQSVTGLSGLSRALLIGGKLKADYVIYGSLTIFGQNASIDANVADVAGQSEPTSIFKQTSSISQVIPEINRFATDINTQVFKRSAAPKFKGAVPGESSQQYASPNQGFILPSKSIPVMGAPGQETTYWRSKDVDELIVAMAFGDVNNDGVKEVVYISEKEVFISQFVNGTFTTLAQTAKSRTNRYISVDVADIDNNGTPEIFVSGLTGDESKVSSFVLEFDGSGYKEILSRSPYLYRVVDLLNGSQILLGQEPVNDKGVFGSPVYRMKSTGKEYIHDEMLLKGKLANVLGVTIGKLGDTVENTTIAFDNKDYIRLFNNNRRASWTGTDKLGGNIARYLVIPKDPESLAKPEYFPTRIRVFDTDQDGKPEVITCANHDISMNLIQGFRSFSKSRMQALAWDSLGLQPIWESRNLSGRISDFFLADFDNDGSVELVISLIKKDKGTLVSTGAVSMLVAFDLVPSKKQ